MSPFELGFTVSFMFKQTPDIEAGQNQCSELFYKFHVDSMTSCNIHVFLMPTIKVESNFSIFPGLKKKER